jgi:hypothetical protein
MKPPLIVQYPERVRDALLDNKLGHLIDYLEDQEYMRKALKEYFEKIRFEEDIPLELDWVYAQYNITISRLPHQQSQN